MLKSPEPLGTGEGGLVLVMFPGGSVGVPRDLPGWRTRLARESFCIIPLGRGSGGGRGSELWAEILPRMSGGRGGWDSRKIKYIYIYV